jgi:hypothetical protein
MAVQYVVDRAVQTATLTTAAHRNYSHCSHCSHCSQRSCNGCTVTDVSVTALSVTDVSVTVIDITVVDIKFVSLTVFQRLLTVVNVLLLLSTTVVKGLSSTFGSTLGITYRKRCSSKMQQLALVARVQQMLLLA